jgi:hypothetical protein
MITGDMAAYVQMERQSFQNATNPVFFKAYPNKIWKRADADNRKARL